MVTTGADRDLSVAARKGSRGLTEPRARARGAPEKCRIYSISENALTFRAMLALALVAVLFHERA